MAGPGYRQEFIDALKVIAAASRTVEAQNQRMPVVVGGAAVEFYTGGAFSTGDFDLVTAWQSGVEAALRDIGFERPRDGTRGLQHYGLGIGVEIVGSALLDGHGRHDKVTVAEIGDSLRVAFIGAEDLIADRVAQYDFHPPSMESRLAQAVVLFRNLEDRLDLPYLDEQIRRQAPGLSLAWLEHRAHHEGPEHDADR